MKEASFKRESALRLGELFDAVKNAQGATVLESCLRHLVDLHAVTAGSASLTKAEFYLLPRCLHNSTNLWAYIRYLEKTGGQQHVLWILKLYSYVQCIEVRYVYKVVGNLLGELGGGIASGSLYDDLHSARQCFGDILKRYECIKSSGRVFGLFDLWSSFLDFDLRNAIGHSDFLISGGSVLVPSNAISQRKKKSTWALSEVNDLFGMANEFNEAFKLVLGDHGVDLGPRY